MGRWGRIARVTISVALGGLLAVLLGPAPVAVGYRSAGDQALVSQVRELVAGPEARAAGVEQGYRSLAVAVVEAGTTRFAFIGDRGDGHLPDATTTFELASITKTFTASILADAVDRGEVRLDDRLSRYLPELSGSPAGRVTLEQLATHRSGLPAYADLLAEATYEGYGSADLQAEDEATVISQTRGLSLSGRGTWQYSNLGVSLLGFALARAAGEPSWVSLVHHRILDPLGMTSTIFARSEAEVPSSAAAGHRVNGSPVDPVTGGGYLPAGTTTFTTAPDMAAYLHALLAGSLPGMWALTPRYDVSDVEWIGLVWYTVTLEGHDVQFHLGGVPGFSSALVVDQTAGRAVVVLGGSEQSVEAVAFHLLDPASSVPWQDRSAVQTVLGLGGLVVVGGAVLTSLRSRRLTWLIAAGLASQVGLLLLLWFGPWHRILALSWGVAVALVIWAAIDAGWRWRALGSGAGRSVSGVVALVVTALAYGVVVWMR